MKYLRTVINTMWLYPIADIEAALATTTYTYTFDGTNIVCPDYTNLRGVYFDIFSQTVISQPEGTNPGFSLGVGTALEDYGGEIFLKIGTQIWVHWINVRQLTPQSPSNIPVPGNSPVDTVGYITVFVSYGANNPDPNIFDAPYVVRVG